MSGKGCPTAIDSPKVEVGEIDTRAPFASVKAAVSLFGEGAVASEKTVMKRPKSIPTERVLAKETQLHMAQDELNKFKGQLKNAETAKDQALAELGKAKRTVEDLTHKLKTVNESKASATKSTEAAKNQAKRLGEANSGNISEICGTWKEALDDTRQQYAISVTELNAAKQELQKIRLDFEAFMGEKAAAFQQAAQAERTTRVYKERTVELSKEIAAVQDSLVLVKLASEQAQQEREENLSEKDTEQQAMRLALDEVEEKLEFLKKEFDPEIMRNLEERLAETDAEIATLHNEMENARVYQESMKAVTTELDSAKIELQKLAEGETALTTSVESLKQELERVKKEHTELEKRELGAKDVSGNLQSELQKRKAELEMAVAGENKARAAVNELTSTLQQLSSQSEHARIEIETLNKDTEELKKEAEVTLSASEEAEKSLQVALKDVEEANRLKVASEEANAASLSTSETDDRIMISVEEYESLNQKIEESNKLAEAKVAEAEAELEAVKASESEALKKLEAAKKEIEETETATREALSRAEMAEAAKQAVDGVVTRWREQEQKRAAEAATLILSESEVPKDPSLRWNQSEKAPSSPSKFRFFKTYSSGKAEGSRTRMEKSSTKRSFLSGLSGIFRRKKSLSEGGSPSYL